jgi:hypothetical protein
MSPQQNRFAEAVIAGKNTQANLLLATTYPMAVGEIAYATDTGVLLIGTDPATGGSFKAVIAKGSGTLTAGTTTTVTNALAKTTSVIIIQPTSAALTLLGVWVSTKSAGSFILTHGIAAGTETFDYLIV